MHRKKVQKFEDLICWQEARIFNRDLFSTIRNCKEFFYRNQILRASLSVTSNIAEGFEKSKKSNKDYVRFLYIAKASCGEVRSQLYLGMDTELISIDSGNTLIGHCKRISYLINQLILAREKLNM